MANTKPIKQAAKLFHNIIAASVKGNPKPKEPAKRSNNYAVPIENMGLPIKVQIVLKNNGVTTLKELASYYPWELMQLKNIGIKSIGLLEKAAAKYGLALGDIKR